MTLLTAAREPRIVDQDDQDIGFIFRRSRIHHDGPVGHRIPDRATGDSREGGITEGQYGSVGIEFAGCFGKCAAQVAQGVPRHLDARLRLGVRKDSLGGEEIAFGNEREYRRRPRLQLVADAALQATLDPMLGEPADNPPGCGPDRHGCQERWSRQTDEDADTATPTGTSAA